MSRPVDLTAFACVVGAYLAVGLGFVAVASLLGHRISTEDPQYDNGEALLYFLFWPIMGAWFAMWLTSRKLYDLGLWLRGGR